VDDEESYYEVEITAGARTDLGSSRRAREPE
jgi:hypothetical protein